MDIDPDVVDPTIETLHRLDLASAEAEAFDADILPRSLSGTGTAQRRRTRQGVRQARTSRESPRRPRFVRGLCDNPREIPIDFDAPEYIQLYPDLRWLTDQSPLEALRHYMRHGRWEPRLHTLRTDPAPPTEEMAALDIGVPDLLAQSARPLCVLAHVYYPELWEELSTYIGNLPQDSYDLYVNLVDDTFDPELLVAHSSDAFPSARVYVSENFGRDVGGHCQLLRNLRMEDYRLFCLLHTKKSPHMGAGEVQRWRRKLIGPLMGSREYAAENIRTLLEDETIGQLGSAACRLYGDERQPGEIRPVARTDEHRGGVGRGGVRLGYHDVSCGRRCCRGCSRWPETLRSRGAANRPWKAMALGAHAIERVFGAVVRDMNYRFEWR